MTSARPSSSDGKSHPGPRAYGSDQRARESSPYTMRPPSPRRRPDGRFYADRSSLPVPPARRTPSRQKRMSWPPSPAVEDENVALAKEANPDKGWVSDTDEAQSRGTIDQSPIILDVPEQLAKLQATEFAENQPQSTESQARGRQRSLPEEDIFAEPALMPRRQASPYVFTPKAPVAPNGELDDSGYFSSRDMKVPMRSAAGTNRRFPAATTPSKPLGQNSPRSSLLTPRESSDDTFDSTTDDDAAPKAIPDRRPSRYSSVHTDKQKDELRTSLRAMMGSAGQTRPHSSDGRGLGDPSSSFSSSAGNLPRRPAPLNSVPNRNEKASLVTPLYTSALSGVMGRNSSSRPSSPSPGNMSMPLSPPRSPVGSIHSRNDSSQNGWTSRPGSRPTSRGGSRPGSRAASPSPSDHSRFSFVSDRADETVRRTATFPAMPDERSPRLSRLSEATFPPPDATSRVPNPPTPSSLRTKALPYPVDERSFAMPSAEVHRQSGLPPNWPPSQDQNVMYNTKDMPRTPLPATVDSIRRPVSRHTVSEGIPAAFPGIFPAAAVAPGNTRAAEGVISAAENLPPCPRSTSSTEHSDWYGLEGLPSFNICPSCFESTFAESAFRAKFKRQPRKDREAKTKCDFASPWTRLAFALTKQQRRTDLNLMYAVAGLVSTERACPGKHREARTWYTVVNEHGEGIERFDVCSRDVKLVETLMPSLQGIFARAYTHTHRRRCDLRCESKRFPRYIELLLDINDKSARSRRSPDLQPFIDFASKKAQVRECSRDDVVPNESWHIIPQLPEFTVCEECYTDVVWPAIANGSPVAARFNRTPIMVVERTGSSCQLYSARMRKIFDKAVRRSDFQYLAQHARERKSKEILLQTQFASVRDLLEGKASTYNGPQLALQTRLRNRDDCADEIERIAAEWKKWE